MVAFQARTGPKNLGQVNVSDARKLKTLEVPH
jgi:hypothetical protein